MGGKKQKMLLNDVNLYTLHLKLYYALPGLKTVQLVT